ncbi:hypothetical protein LINGRAHAP2_LOCUS20316 [Linum grandiflorum]
MNLATETELVGVVLDWPTSRYLTIEIEKCRNYVSERLVGKDETYAASTTSAYRITRPLYRFMHLLFNGKITLRVDKKCQYQVTTTEIDLF